MTNEKLIEEVQRRLSEARETDVKVNAVDVANAVLAEHGPAQGNMHTFMRRLRMALRDEGARTLSEATGLQQIADVELVELILDEGDAHPDDQSGWLQRMRSVLAAHGAQEKEDDPKFLELLEQGYDRRAKQHRSARDTLRAVGTILRHTGDRTLVDLYRRLDVTGPAELTAKYGARTLEELAAAAENGRIPALV
jgi:hypothetical protein